MISQEKLDFWIKNSYNVLFVGKHGVGKTSIIKEAFERANLRWMYFSASTMDPWVDMVGVPKERKSEDGTSYLDLVRPREFQNDEVEALFFDEFNRSHKKVRNAVMELIQFKSINGRRFNNLKIVWAAINPDDEETYDVEKLDPAQEDRFHIKIDVAYSPYLPYFTSRYGKTVAKSAVSWWKELPNEQKDLVSPRRLDYALDIFAKNGDMRDALPHTCNVSKLVTFLQSGPISESLKKLFDTKDIEGARTFLQAENNFAASFPHFIKKAPWLEFFTPLVSNEKLVVLMTKKDPVLKHVVSNIENIPHYKQVVEDVIAANQSKTLIKKLKKEVGNLNLAKEVSGNSSGISPWYIDLSLPQYGQTIDAALTKIGKAHNTYQRKCIWDDVVTYGVPKTLSLVEAEKTLAFCNQMASSSHISTLDTLTNFYGMLNQALDQLHCHTKLSWVKLVKQYHYKIQCILYKMNQNSKFSSKIRYP